MSAKRVVLIAAALAVPCFWQSRIQAGDLSSHAYNAWLAMLVEQGKTTGLVVAPQYTNVLFDLALLWLTNLIGSAWAQKILVAASVEIFVWGAAVLAWTVAGRRSWFLMPCLAMLGYGAVFHFGFFNFYLSFGFCFWALAALQSRRFAAVPPLLALAVLAHALPVAWTVAVATYAWLVRRPRLRIALPVAALLFVIFLRLFLTARFPVRAFAAQVMFVTGADQLWIYGAKYLLLAFLLFLTWTMLFARLAGENGLRKVIAGVPFQVAVLTAAGVVLIPTGILLPGYRHMLVYISDRMSLATAVTVCVMLAAANPPRALKAAMAALAAVYFAFLYADARALNRIEDSVQAAVSALPPAQRVTSGLAGRDTRIDPLSHMIDRACIGRCFSYGNYEPSTHQFRVRAVAANPIVVADYGESYTLQTGGYVVKPRDLPLYAVVCAGPPDRCVRPLAAGETAQPVPIAWQAP